MTPGSTPPDTGRRRPSLAEPDAGRRQPSLAEPDGRRRLGRCGEELAAAHLQRLGFVVLARNVRTRHGEIDLIAFDGRTLVFAEVKTRRSRHGRGTLPAHDGPLASLGARQRLRLRRLALAWLSSDRSRASQRRPSAETIRFDALGVVVDEQDRLLCLDHLEGAW
ncbi:MAG TPA: YraN family protein [Solirubrobacteraceae bacterium]|jgi:putative endonuclease|nr:YraN family protein [Solirubrobacteraceae bacterium]